MVTKNTKMNKTTILAMSFLLSLSLAWGSIVEVHKVVAKEGSETIKVTMQGEDMILDKHAAITELDIAKASLNPEREGVISIELDAKGTQKFSELTKELAATKGRLAILLNGKVVTAPVVQSELGKKFEITGYTESEEKSIKELVEQINTVIKNNR